MVSTLFQFFFQEEGSGGNSMKIDQVRKIYVGIYDGINIIRI